MALSLTALFAAWFMMAGERSTTSVLESRRLHLGKVGQTEWEAYKTRPVDGEKLELRFQASTNATEQTLLIWQKDVKLGWPVILNGRKLGALIANEAALESVFAIAPGFLREGENVLEIAAPATLDDIEVGPIILSALPTAQTLNGAHVEVTVTDADHQTGIPCRLTLTRPDGTLQPLQASPVNDVAVRVGVVYTREGKAGLSLPPGDYVLYAGHGFEWSVQRVELKLLAGNNPPVALALKREVNTEGWIAADSHIHTLTHSGHGDAKIEERLLTIAGEGIELAIATDHNHHADYAPALAAMRLSGRFTPVIGNEVTTKHGHFNAFPIAPGATVVDHHVEDWAKLIPAIRATAGVKVITLNHPRDLHSGFVPFGSVQFNPSTGKHRQADALKDVDAMEVVTSAAMQSDIQLLFRDWFALLNRGHRIAAIGSSDSHDVSRYILGQGRTYVAAKDSDPAQVPLDEVWQSYQKGRLLVSMGLLAKVKVNDRFETGDLVTGPGATLKVQVSVLGPSWVTADRVALYANGLLIKEQVIKDEQRAGEKAAITWEIPRPSHDVHLVVIASGPGVIAPYWEIPRPYQASSDVFHPRVIGSTNPVWIDGDGDGKFQSAFDYARALVQQYGNDVVKLRAALAGYDESVAIQAGSLDATEIIDAR